MHLPTQNIPVIIDGPNCINRLIDFGIASGHLAKQLSLRCLRELINRKLAEIPSISGSCGSAEFICSRKRFGPESKKFSEEQQKNMLNRFRAEVGVFVDVIDIPGSSEKGVDTTIAGRLQDLGGEVPAAVLISEDRDFIPTLQKLRHRLKVILFSISGSPPVELQNEAYATVLLGEDYRSLFTYSYPSFQIEELDAQKLAELFAEADDRQLNQLRVDHSGEVYIVKLDSSLHDPMGKDTKFRLESYGPYNGYLGPKKASDDAYINKELQDLKLAWMHDIKGYVDYPVEAMIRSISTTSEKN